MQVKLISLRKQKGITQDTMSKLIGISKNQYSNKELGKNKFYGDEMFKIAEFFGLKVEDIFLPREHQYGVKTKK